MDEPAEGMQNKNISSNNAVDKTKYVSIDKPFLALKRLFYFRKDISYFRSEMSYFR